MRFEVKKN